MDRRLVAFKALIFRRTPVPSFSRTLPLNSKTKWVAPEIFSLKYIFNETKRVRTNQKNLGKKLSFFTFQT